MPELSRWVLVSQDAKGNNIYKRRNPKEINGKKIWNEYEITDDVIMSEQQAKDRWNKIENSDIRKQNGWPNKWSIQEVN